MTSDEEVPIDQLTSDVLFMITLIFLGSTFFKSHQKSIPLPYTVVLFLYGIVIGRLALWVSPRVATTLGAIPSDLLFYIFLPVLIFEGSYAINIHALRRIFWHAALLATVGIIVNTILLALPGKLLLPEWSWFSVLLLGALLSATDPVAVVTLLKNLGVEKRITALLDSESVMNDGTAIIAYTLLFPAAKLGHLSGSVWIILLKCIQLCVLPLILGPLFGYIQYFWLHRTREELAQACITVSVTYVSYYVSYFLLGTSGVLTVFFQGIFLSYYYPSLFPGRQGNLIYATWEFLVHLGNTVLFALIGVILVADVFPTLKPNDLIVIVCMYVVMLIARLLMLELLGLILNALSSFKLDQRAMLLMVHAGLRGGVAATLALGTKQGGLQDGIGILKISSGVVLLSLLINASSAEIVVRALRFNTKLEHQAIQMNYALNYLRDAKERALEYIKRDVKYQNANWLPVENFIARGLKNPYAHDIILAEEETLAVNRLLMSTFKASLWQQRDEKRISETVMVELGSIVATLIEHGELFDLAKLKMFSTTPQSTLSKWASAALLPERWGRRSSSLTPNAHHTTESNASNNVKHMRSNNNNNKNQKCNGVNKEYVQVKEMHTIQNPQYGKHNKNNSSDDICSRDDVYSSDNNTKRDSENHHHHQKQEPHRRRLHLFDHHEEEPVVEPLCNSNNNIIEKEHFNQPNTVPKIDANRECAEEEYRCDESIREMTQRESLEVSLPLIDAEKSTQMGIQENENEVDDMEYNEELEHPTRKPSAAVTIHSLADITSIENNANHVSCNNQERTNLKKTNSLTRLEVLPPKNNKYNNKDDDDDDDVDDDEMPARAAVTVKDFNNINDIQARTDVKSINSSSHEVVSDSVCATSEGGNADELVESLKQRLLPPWARLLEKCLCGKGYFKLAHRRAQENAFMVLLAIAKCLGEVSTFKYNYITSTSQARRVEMWLDAQLELVNRTIYFFYENFPTTTNNVASTRAVLSVAYGLTHALLELDKEHGFGAKVHNLLLNEVDEMRKTIPHEWTSDLPSKESELVMNAVSSSNLGRGLRKAEIRAISAMGLIRKFIKHDIITLPQNSFLIVVFGSIRAVHNVWTTMSEYELVESFGDMVGVESFLLPDQLRKDQQRQWRVLTPSATTLIISFNSINPFLTERSLRSVKALWRAAAVEVILPFLQDMITLPRMDTHHAHERLNNIVSAGTPLIGPKDCSEFDWGAQFYLCFYLRGSDTCGLFGTHTPPCYISTLFAHELKWNDSNVVLYAIPMQISDALYMPWLPEVSSLNNSNNNSLHSDSDNESNSTSDRSNDEERRPNKNKRQTEKAKRKNRKRRADATHQDANTETHREQEEQEEEEELHSINENHNNASPALYTSQNTTLEILNDILQGKIPDALRLTVLDDTQKPEHVNQSNVISPNNNINNLWELCLLQEEEEEQPMCREIKEQRKMEQKMKQQCQYQNNSMYESPRHHLHSSNNCNDSNETLPVDEVARYKSSFASQKSANAFDMRHSSHPETHFTLHTNAMQTSSSSIVNAANTNNATAIPKSIYSSLLQSPLFVSHMRSRSFNPHSLIRENSSDLCNIPNTVIDSPCLKYNTKVICILQDVREFVTPVPYVNQLFMRYAAMLEQLCIAALRFLKYPDDSLHVRHAERVAEITMEFLLGFCLEMSLLKRGVLLLLEQTAESNTNNNMNTNTKLRILTEEEERENIEWEETLRAISTQDECDELFECKVCAWDRNVNLTRKYHLRTIIMEMNSYANKRFPIFVHSIRVMARMVPELSNAESVEGLHAILMEATHTD